MEDKKPQHKAGFANIIGRPNVGKSTLMNALVGEKLSIITPKAQTTRHRIFGILNHKNYQIIFSDTPGIIDPKYKLQESMMNFVDSTFKDADVLIFLTDQKDQASVKEAYIEKAKNMSKDVPVIICINKIDTYNLEQQLKIAQEWQEKLPEAAAIIPISALKKKNTDRLLDVILKYIPEFPPYYPKDQLTDKPERFFVSEIVREKIFLFYKQEIPYSTETVVEEFKEESHIIRIKATIFVGRNIHKSIIIGQGGKMIKKVGTEARKDLEKFFDKKIYIELFVKVKDNWKDDNKMLRQFGYNK